MKTLGLINKVVHKPVECIGGAIAIGFITTGLFILWPGFSIQDSMVLQYIHTLAPVKIVGVLYVALFGLHLFGLTTSNFRVRKFCTFTAFVVFIFFGILRMLLISLDNLIWVNYVIFALIEGISYIRLKWGLDSG